MNDFNTRMKGYIFVIIATSLYGIMPAVASLGYMRGLNSYSLLFGRVAFSVPIYIMMAIYKKESFRITGKQLVWILCMSVFGTANGVLAYMSYTYLPSGIASLMAMMYIVFTMLLEFLLGIEKVKAYKIMILIMSFIGIFIILWTPAGERGISIV
ncbi:MAG: DMT family transporter, partial [Firmicutes bacterium]|nr:DMT family transporter [Bacillota bacterium]